MPCFMPPTAEIAPIILPQELTEAHWEIQNRNTGFILSNRFIKINNNYAIHHTNFNHINLAFFLLTAKSLLVSTLKYHRFNKEDKPAIKNELLSRIRENPKDFLNWIYLMLYGKRLNITQEDLPVESNLKVTYNFKYRHTEFGYLFEDVAFDAFLLEILNFERSNNESTPTILSYSTKVEQVLHVDINKPKIMGIELELSSNSQGLLYAHKHLKKHAIFKRDGSVPNGFEIVTIPTTLNEHRKAMYPFFERASEYLEATSNCGMHVHMTRKGMSFLQIAKIVEFFNKENNAEYIKVIAGRYQNRFCLPKSELNISVVGKNFNEGDPYFGDRYTLVNLQPYRTIEIRAFASTTSIKEFFTRLEFCDALRTYTNPGEVSLSPKESTNFNAFVNWVNIPENKKTYPELFKFHKGL